MKSLDKGQKPGSNSCQICFLGKAQWGLKYIVENLVENFTENLELSQFENMILERKVANTKEFTSLRLQMTSDITVINPEFKVLVFVYDCSVYESLQLIENWSKTAKFKNQKRYRVGYVYGTGGLSKPVFEASTNYI